MNNDSDLPARKSADVKPVYHAINNGSKPGNCDPESTGQPVSSGATGNSSEPWSGASDSLQLNEGGVRYLYEQVIAYAEACGVDAKSCDAIREIGGAYVNATKFLKVATILQTLLYKQESKSGKNHPILAQTEMLIGLCQQRARQLDPAAKTLRSAITRFQQSDSVDCEQFIECLCTLATIYRTTRKFEAGRTCIKQAYRILPTGKSGLRLQCRVLEELSATLLSEHKYRAAATAYKRLVQIKDQLSKVERCDVIRPLIGLSMAYFALHKFDESEESLVRACEMYYHLNHNDQYLLVELLEKLSGTLRHHGQFIQADLLEERAHELLSRSDQMGGHAAYGNLLEVARLAELSGDLDAARQNYRNALVALELQREKRIAERIPILAHLFLMTTGEQFIQRTSLLADIEDALSEIFCGAAGSMAAALNRLALLYRLLGRPNVSRDLCQLIAELNLNQKMLPGQFNSTEKKLNLLE